MENSTQNELVPVYKSDEQIKKAILTTIMRMLRYRKWIDYNEWTDDKIESHINKLEGNIEDEIMLTKFKSMKVYVKQILSAKITGVNKDPSIIEFIEKRKDDYKIIIVKDITNKTKQTIKTLYKNVEIFRQVSLMMDIVSHHYSPDYEVLTPDEVTELLKTYNSSMYNIARLPSTELIVDYLNIKPGQVVRILRKSQQSGVALFYRRVV